MKNLQKIMSIILVLVMIFAFASCKDDENEYEQGSSTSTTESTTEESTTEESTTEESTTEKEESTTKKKESNTKKETTTKKKESTTKTSDKETTTKKQTETGVTMEQIAGTYVATETITPQEFYGEYYDSEICKTTLKIKTYYEFGPTGNFVTYTKIENESAIRAEYKAVMVKVAKESCEAEGVEFDDETRAYAEEMADEVIDAITEETYATYEIQGNKFVYTIDGYSINETFTLNGKNIVLTGSSIGNEGYPITLVKL